jgi:hypothetical protein
MNINCFIARKSRIINYEKWERRMARGKYNISGLLIFKCFINI